MQRTMTNLRITNIWDKGLSVCLPTYLFIYLHDTEMFYLVAPRLATIMLRTEDQWNGTDREKYMYS
jgi:hypothetical protein